MAKKSAEHFIRERTDRLGTAVKLGTPDRVPVVLGFDAFAARQRDIKMSEFVSDPYVAGRAMLRTMELLGDVDAIQKPTSSPGGLSTLWLSIIDRPGKELSDDSLWQVNEQVLMTPGDYDRIINEGWQPWRRWYMNEHLLQYTEEVQALIASTPLLMQEYREAGVLVFSPQTITTPYEYFCGARSMKEFMLDLHRMPDKVEEAMDRVMAGVVEETRGNLASMSQKPMAMWVGGWRSASEFLSPLLWERFVFPYIKQAVDVVVQAGVIPELHFDSNWTRDLERFRELPKAKCVLALDGMTDIFKAKEVLGDHMCILGDVPPRMLTLGSRQEVTEYCSRLVKEIGPDGFILSQGCYLPPDAKLENVQAMVEAVHH